MHRPPMPPMVAALVLGLALPGTVAEVACPPGLAIVAAAIACAALWLRSGAALRPSLVALALGMVIAGARPPTIDMVLDTPRAVIEGVVWEANCGPERLACAVVLRDARVGERPVAELRVRFPFLDAVPPPGALVVTAGSVRGTGRRATALGILEPQVLVGSGGASLTAVAARLRHALGTLGDPRAVSLYRALLLGDRGGIAQRTRWSFQDTGTAHLLAISGLHIGIVAWGLHRVLLWLLVLWRPGRQRRRRQVYAGALTVLLVGLFAALIAPSDATARAVLAVAIVLGAAAAGRRTPPLRVLLWAAAVSLTVDPAAIARAGFQLSFAAAAALVLGIGVLRAVRSYWDEPGRVRSDRRRRALTAACQLVVVNALAFIATAPLSVAWFGQFAVAGLAVNLVAVPLMALIILPLGGLWGILVALVPALAAAVAPAVATLGATFVTGLEHAAELVGSSVVAGWPMALGVLGTAAVIALIAGTGRRWVGALGMAATVVWAAALAADQAGGGGALVVSLLDVGHGDAILVQPPAGGAMLVDAGGTRGGAERNAARADWLLRSLRGRGVSALDVLVITHPDRDHIGGAEAVARRLPVGALWLGPCAYEHPAARRLGALVRRRGGAVHVVSRHAAVPWRGASVAVLWPTSDRLGPDGCRDGANDASLVVAVAHAGRRILLTGDIEASAEAQLVADPNVNLSADVLKVPHHGSRTSSTPAFIAAVAPRWALVSGIERPGPMPPHADVLTRYAQAGIATAVTGRQGDVTVTVAGNGELTVASERASPSPPIGVRPP